MNHIQPLLSHSSISHNPQSEPNFFSPSFGLKALVGYLYFIQGVILSLPATMPFIYEQLPQYQILSLFSAALLPFSFKFITAPIIQKFSSLEYGKRKTWIIISQLISSFMIFIGAFITQQSYAAVLAIIFILAVFFITLQDISLDAVAIKQLRIPYLVGLLQGIMQTVGLIVGGLFFLKLTSTQFSNSIGFSQAITTPKMIMIMISLVILIPTIAIHFNYKETLLENQKKVKSESLLNIISYYKVFFDKKTKYCRAFFFFLIYLQGFVLYEAYYEYELVQKHDFSRNTINSITNIILIPVTIIGIILAPRLNKFGWLKSMMSCLVFKWVMWALVLMFFPTSVTSITIIYFFVQLIETIRFILVSILINEFPVMGLSAMFITMLNSASNFGRLNSLHIYLTGIWGWHMSALLGLIIQLVILVFFRRIFGYIEEGKLDVENLVTIQKQKRNSEVFAMVELKKENTVEK